MSELIGSPIDRKNIGLAITLFNLRNDLDVYSLISLNASQIEASGKGRFFFGHVQKRMVESIALGICKVYEDEKGYELNSISGIIKNLIKTGKAPLDHSKIKEFVQKYGSPTKEMPPARVLSWTLHGFRKKHNAELDRFKKARNKIIAHSEFDVNIDSLPSFDIMERLFWFGADFYAVIGEVFLAMSPADLCMQQVKRNFRKLLESLGIPDIKTEMI